jgi:hypothetical protein
MKLFNDIVSLHWLCNIYCRGIMVMNVENIWISVKSVGLHLTIVSCMRLDRPVNNYDKLCNQDWLWLLNSLYNKVKGNLYLCLISTAPWIFMGQWRYSATILDFCTRWQWVVSFTPRSLYSRRKGPGSQCIGGDWVDPRAISGTVPLPGNESCPFCL